MKPNKDTNLIGDLAVRYEQHTGIRALLHLIPGWGSADAPLTQRAEEIRVKRLKILLDELARGARELTPELIESEDYLHCFFLAWRAAQNTRRRAKIRMFARLLNASTRDGAFSGSDDFEELLAVLNDITLREFGVLLLLREFEQRHAQEVPANILRDTKEYWQEFKERACADWSIRPDEFDAFMARLERTGLFLLIHVTALDNRGDIGRTTAVLTRLSELVVEEDFYGRGSAADDQPR